MPILNLPPALTSGDDLGGGLGTAAAAAEAAAAAAKAAGAASAAAARAAAAAYAASINAFRSALSKYSDELGAQYWGLLNRIDPKFEFPEGDWRSWKPEGSFTMGKRVRVTGYGGNGYRLGPYNCSIRYPNVGSLGGEILTSPPITVERYPPGSGVPCGVSQQGIRIKGADGMSTYVLIGGFADGDKATVMTESPRVFVRNADGSAGDTPFQNPEEPEKYPPPPGPRPLPLPLPLPVAPPQPGPAPDPANPPEEPPNKRPAPPQTPPDTPERPTEPPPARPPQTPPIRPPNPQPLPPGPVTRPPDGQPGTGTGTGTGTLPGQKPQRPVLPDGTPAPEPGPGPAPERPPNEEDVPGGVVGQPGTEPRADLKGIAQTVGKIEQKLLIEMAKVPPPIDWSELIDLIRELLGGRYTFPAGSYSLSPVCEYDANGSPKPPKVVTWPQGEGNFLELNYKLEALAMLLQFHKEIRQPVCFQKPSGATVTVDFQEPHGGTWENRPVRKRLTYRDQGGGSLESHTDGWIDFQWETGPYQVTSIGKWGRVQVYAASRAEGERVIRRAASLASYAIDLDPSHQWQVYEHGGGRIGKRATVEVRRLRDGVAVRWREGPSGPSMYRVEAWLGRTGRA